MYPASSGFHQEAKQLSRQFRGYIIVYIDGTEYQINSTDYLISMEFTDDIYSDRLVGSFIAKTCNVKLYNDLNLNFENAEFNAFMGILVDDNFEFIPMGRYIVQSYTNEEVGNIVNLNCMDSTIKFNQELKNYDILTFPTTLDGLINQIASFVGVSFVSGTIYPNSDLTFSEKPYLSLEWTCRDIIGYLAEACGCYAKINRENKLIIGQFNLNIKNPVSPLYTIDKSMYSKISIQNMYGIVNSIVLSRQPQNDNIYKKDDLSITDNGLTEIQIINNYFIDPQKADSPDIRPNTIVPIFDKLNGFYYYPFSCEAFGNPAWESGDVIHLVDVESNVYPTMITQIKTTYGGGFRQVLKATALTKTEIDYSTGSTIYDRLNNVELIVDKQGGIIQTIITSTEKPSVVVSATAPENPTEGLLWYDVSDIENPILKIFNGEIWVNTSDVDISGDLEAFKEELYQYVNDELAPIIEQNEVTSQQLANALSDNYVTQYEKLDLQSTFNQITIEYNEMITVLQNYDNDLFPPLEVTLTNKYERLSILIDVILANMDEDTNLNLIDMPELPIIGGIQSNVVLSDVGTFEIAKMSYQAIRVAIDEYHQAYQDTYGMVLFVTKTELNTISSEIKQTNEMVDIVFEKADFAEGVAKEIDNHFTFNEDGTFEIYATVGETEGQFKTIISNNKIEFNENNNPVAWLSNQELFVKTANIQNVIKIGQMTIQASANKGIVFKWGVEE